MCCLFSCENSFSSKAISRENTLNIDTSVEKVIQDTILNIPVLDTADYRLRVLALAHDSVTNKWPAVSDIPLPGALLPFNRVVAVYGNFYSKNMGILGQLPEDELIKTLQKEVDSWVKADPKTPVVPAIHYIATTAQRYPGKGNTYSLRMPEKQIIKAIELARKVNGITFLDI